MAADLLLLRHGIAAERAPGQPDDGRELTEAGRQRTRIVLERLVASGLRADRLLASPLARARQTAELAVAAGLAPRLDLAEALAPGGDPLPLIGAWLADLGGGPAPGPAGAAGASAGAGSGGGGRGGRRRLALVGHEPDLGTLAARLIGAAPGSIDLRKAGLAVLRLPGPAIPAGLEGRARLRLLIAPRVLLAGG